MKDDTKLVHLGRHPERHFGAVNTPPFRASTILHPTLEVYEKAAQPFVYGRRGTPTTRYLEEAIAALEGGDRTVLTPSGLSACTIAILAFSSAGDHILVTDGCYGPTRNFCTTTLKRLGIETEFYDPCIGGGIVDLMREKTRLVFCESPSSLTFEVQDIPAIAAAAHARGALVLADNTWATPLLFRAFEKGVDVSIHAATKYLTGHADANVGTITVKEPHVQALVQTHGNLGQCASADEAYLMTRGLRTLSVRLARSAGTGLRLAQFLKSRPEVARILHPALEGDPGHVLWKRDFLGTSGLFGFELKPCSEAARRAFFDGLELFGLGASWGGYESLIVPAHPKRKEGAAHATGPLVRISAGLEDPDDLIADLAAGLARLAAASG